jgi:uncharacterized lipoprotein YajG
MSRLFKIFFAYMIKQEKIMKKIIVACLALTILSGCSTTGQIVHLGFVAAQPNQGADTEDEDDD